MTRVRVRGIYTTALTRRFRQQGHTVVQASAPIRRRFDGDFESEASDATVETTSDRQGVGVIGRPDPVETVTETVAETGLDTFVWSDDAPRSAVFDAAVTEALGSGAVVALDGNREAFLPYSNVDGYVDEGDHVRVQVYEPASPWTDDRPVVGTDLKVFGGLVSLDRGSDAVTAKGPDSETRHELVQLTELLPTDPPEEWGVRWEHGATDATIDEMDAALKRGTKRVAVIEDALDTDDSSNDASERLVAPERTTWVWFGRESRFALDDVRREVETTMAGHHRTKAAHSAASQAVDFTEDVCNPDGEFPMGAVLRAFGPSEGDRVAIEHGKPDGRCITLGRGTATECVPDEGRLTVERKMTAGGTYDALGVERERGDTAVTTFKEGRWWYPTVYRSEDGEVKGTYVNVCTPAELFPNAVRYVDLHVDVVKHADGTVVRVDDDELDESVDVGTVAPPLADKARQVASAVESALGN